MGDGPPSDGHPTEPRHEDVSASSGVARGDDTAVADVCTRQVEGGDLGGRLLAYTLGRPSSSSESGDEVESSGQEDPSPHRLDH